MAGFSAACLSPDFAAASSRQKRKDIQQILHFQPCASPALSMFFPADGEPAEGKKAYMDSSNNISNFRQVVTSLKQQLSDKSQPHSSRSRSPGRARDQSLDRQHERSRERSHEREAVTHHRGGDTGRSAGGGFTCRTHNHHLPAKSPLQPIKHEPGSCSPNNDGDSGLLATTLRQNPAAMAQGCHHQGPPGAAAATRVAAAVAPVAAAAPLAAVVPAAAPGAAGVTTAAAAVAAVAPATKEHGVSVADAAQVVKAEPAAGVSEGVAGVCSRPGGAGAAAVTTGGQGVTGVTTAAGMADVQVAAAAAGHAVLRTVMPATAPGFGAKDATGPAAAAAGAAAAGGNGVAAAAPAAAIAPATNHFAGVAHLTKPEPAAGVGVVAGVCSRVGAATSRAASVTIGSEGVRGVPLGAGRTAVQGAPAAAGPPVAGTVMPAASATAAAGRGGGGGGDGAAAAVTPAAGVQAAAGHAVAHTVMPAAAAGEAGAGPTAADAAVVIVNRERRVGAASTPSVQAAAEVPRTPADAAHAVTKAGVGAVGVIKPEFNASGATTSAMPTNVGSGMGGAPHPSSGVRVAGGVGVGGAANGACGMNVANAAAEAVGAGGGGNGVSGSDGWVGAGAAERGSSAGKQVGMMGASRKAAAGGGKDEATAPPQAVAVAAAMPRDSDLLRQIAEERVKVVHECFGVMSSRQTFYMLMFFYAPAFARAACHFMDEKNIRLLASVGATPEQVLSIIDQMILTPIERFKPHYFYCKISKEMMPTSRKRSRCSR